MEALNLNFLAVEKRKDEMPGLVFAKIVGLTGS